MSKPTPSQREIIRVSLLRYIVAGDGSISSAFLLQFIRNEGFRSVDDAWLSSELQYLVDKGLIAQVAKLISTENRHWRITALGRDFLAESANE